MIVRLRGKLFEDVGSQHWKEFEKEIRAERAKIKSQNLQELLHSNPNEIHDDLDYLGTQSSVLLIVLDYLYAGRPEEARKALGELWPVEFQEQTWKEIINGYCSGLRSKLGLANNAACKNP